MPILTENTRYDAGEAVAGVQLSYDSAEALQGRLHPTSFGRCMDLIAPRTSAICPTSPAFRDATMPCAVWTRANKDA